VGLGGIRRRLTVCLSTGLAVAIKQPSPAFLPVVIVEPKERSVIQPQLRCEHSARNVVARLRLDTPASGDAITDVPSQRSLRLVAHLPNPLPASSGYA